jgi:hypothetical protein
MALLGRVSKDEARLVSVIFCCLMVSQAIIFTVTGQLSVWNIITLWVTTIVMCVAAWVLERNCNFVYRDTKGLPHTYSVQSVTPLPLDDTKPVTPLVTVKQVTAHSNRMSASNAFRLQSFDSGYSTC